MRFSKYSSDDAGKSAVVSVSQEYLKSNIYEDSSVYSMPEHTFTSSSSSSYTPTSPSISETGTSSTRSATSLANSLQSSVLSSSHDEQSCFTTKKTVTFGNISIREFDLTAGDNPACSSGVPITLGWTYNPVHDEFPIDVFEGFRDGHRCATSNELKLSERVRYRILANEWKVSKATIAKAERRCRQSKNERQESLEGLLYWDHDDMEGAENREDVLSFTEENPVPFNKTNSRLTPFFRTGTKLKSRFVQMLKR